MPFGGWIAGKRPLDVGPRQARQDVWVTEEVQRIVEADKTKIPDREIDGKRGQEQEKRNKRRLAKQMKLAGVLVHGKMKTNGPRERQKKADWWIVGLLDW